LNLAVPLVAPSDTMLMIAISAATIGISNMRTFVRNLQGTPHGTTADRINVTTTMVIGIAARTLPDTVAVVTRITTTSRFKIIPTIVAQTGVVMIKDGAMLEIGSLGRVTGSRTANATSTSMISLLERSRIAMIIARIFRSQILAVSIGKWCRNLMKRMKSYLEILRKKHHRT
jgi:hypothetical protein